MYNKNKKKSFYIIIVIVLLIILLNKKANIKNNNIKITNMIKEYEKNIPEIIFDNNIKNFSSTKNSYINNKFPIKFSNPFSDIQPAITENKTRVKIVFDNKDPYKLNIIAVKINISKRPEIKSHSKYFKFNLMKYMLNSKNLSKLSNTTRAFRAGFIPKNIGYGILKRSKLKKCYEVNINNKKGLMFLSSSDQLDMYHIFLWENENNKEYFLIEILTKLKKDSKKLKELINSITL